MADTAPTREEINRVRRWECEQEGHLIEIVVTQQSHDPQGIVCSRCGKTWSLDTAATRDRDRLLTAIREHQAVRSGQASDLDDALYRLADEIGENADG